MKLIAIGNRFMKDDGIAVLAAEYLKDDLEENGIEVIIGETDYQGCFHLLNENDFVVILDALYTGSKPASIHIYNLKDVLSQKTNLNTQHDMSIIDLMKLYNLSLKGYIIGIEVSEISLGDKLSLTLSERFSDICMEIKNIIIKISVEENYYA